MEMPTVTNHAPVTMAVFASALAAVAMAFCRAKYGINFEGQEANLQVIATGIGYLVAGQKVGS